MKKLLPTLVLAPLLLSVTMGATDCESFGTVIVPASDTSSPFTWDGVWRDGEYVVLHLSSPNSPVTYHYTPGEVVFPVATGTDSGGMKKVTMAIETWWQCCSGSICSNTSSLSVPVVGTQPGGVGQPVSDGIYVASYVNHLPTCNPGYTLEGYAFSWTTTAEDFQGRKTTGPTNRIVYP